WRGGWGIEDRNRQRLGIASGCNSCLVQARRRAFRFPISARAWEPAVAEFDNSADCMLALSAQEHGRMRLLLWLGVKPDRIEIDELAVKFGLLLRPKLPHSQDTLAQQLETRLVAGAVILHFFDVPASADGENEPAARQLVEARH